MSNQARDAARRQPPLGRMQKIADQSGFVCSVLGLAAWTLAILTAVAQPLFGLQVPATWVMALVIASGVLTLIAIPQLMRKPLTTDTAEALIPRYDSATTLSDETAEDAALPVSDEPETRNAA